MKMKSKKRATQSIKSAKVWWAYDVTTKNDTTHVHTLKVLEPFLKALKTTATPVSVLDPYHTDENGRPIFALFPVLKCNQEQLVAHATTRLQKIIALSKMKCINKPELLFNISDIPPSLRDKAALISRAAHKGGATLVAIRTHQRDKLTNLFLGSFSETFSEASTLPTLLIPGLAKPASRISKTLFPTDFSKSSHAAFNNFLLLAKELRTKITIVHYLSSQESTEALIREDKAYACAEEMVVAAHKNKVTATVKVLHQQSTFDPAGEIINYGKKNNYQLIALVSQSGSMRASILGATSREIARLSSCPVLIYRPKQIN